MNILMAHNRYKIRGGEDKSFEIESRILENNGHKVIRYEKSNDDIINRGLFPTALNTFWNRDSYSEVYDIVRNGKIDIAHFQNTFPIISPSSYYAASKGGAIVVQALRNYRLTCVNGLMFRNGGTCHDCLGKILPLNGVLHRCYRDSLAGSSVVATMTGMHRILRTYHKKIDGYIAVSEYVKKIYIEAGFPEEKIYVKPNVVSDYGYAKGIEREFFIYIGRISREKGIEDLLAAWSEFSLPIKIIGEGPLLSDLIEKYTGADNIEFMGYVDINDANQMISRAYAVIIPSQWDEPFGRVAAEALASGTPVITARSGGLTEIIQDGVNGKTFERGNVPDIIRSIKNFIEERESWQSYYHNARISYEKKYSEDVNYKRLIEIYNSLREKK